MSHPGWVPISTTDRNAPVRVDALDAGASVLSFDRDGGALIRRKGYDASVESRGARSIVTRVRTVDGHRVEVSAGHRMVVRWSARPGVAVYLMRNTADQWRVGTADLHPDAQGYCFGPARRATDEGATALWVLDVYPDVRAAHRVESYVSHTFGVTERCFKRYAIDGATDQPEPFGALREFGRSPSRPLWRAGERKHRGCRASMDLAASNLVPGWMKLPTDDGRGLPRWLGFDVESYAFDGDLYAVTVEKYHHYLADGIIVRDSTP